MATYIYVNIDLDNGLLPDSTNQYPNQCWLIIKGVLWHSPENNFTRSAHELNLKQLFGDYAFKITMTSNRGQWVNQTKRKQDKTLCLFHRIYFIFSSVNFRNNLASLTILINSKFAITRVPPWWGVVGQCPTTMRYAKVVDPDIRTSTHVTCGQALSATSTHFKWELMLYCLHCPTLNKVFLLLLLLLLKMSIFQHTESWTKWLTSCIHFQMYVVH